ncbi:MAG: 23S rRNA (adenine(2503)-C(2))-methyltransferase RlmN [Zetaproteobacteria bacterium]|nr:23S rRNA (adenine(2503)-C(2))-methyltransferase RlmN [Pseudobdellovibrionaceae bacterium]|tara:strand:+ start:351 stop:1424 length:1074 start_codon:yes stop_codon:yes gene_type:complete
MIRSIFSYSKTELEDYLLSKGHKKFRAQQLFDWLYKKRVADISLMKNLPKSLQEELGSLFTWPKLDIIERLNSSDGASKLLLKGLKQQSYEAVILRYENRTSLCVSSQVGCKLACAFCQTGKLGFFRHLSLEEILGQFYLANQIVSEEGRQISHVVFMGMGEPLDNFENVLASVEALTDEARLGLSSRKVTVSTSGLADRIEELSTKTKSALAISLHACNDKLRSKLMPINRRYSLARLKESLHTYQKNTGNKITLEYILIQGENMAPQHAKELVKFIHGLKVKVNLIPFNEHPGMPFKRPVEQEIEFFQKHLSERGIPSPVRYSKGQGVSAACGQLAAKDKEKINCVPLRKNVVGF